MQKLIIKLKNANTGSRELDEKIAFIVKWRPQNQESKLSFKEHEAKNGYSIAWIAHAPWRKNWMIPPYTTNFETAVTIIPKEWQSRGLLQFGSAYKKGIYIDKAGVILHHDLSSGGVSKILAYAKTPALALCIAVLKIKMKKNEKWFGNINP